MNQFCLCIKSFELIIFDNWLIHHTDYQFSIGKQFQPLIYVFYRAILKNNFNTLWLI